MNSEGSDLTNIAISLSDLSARVEGLHGEIKALDRLTEAKFVTYQTMLTSQAEQVKQALDAAEKAIDKAEAAVDKRLDGMNEFRDSLSDQSKDMLRKEEYMTNHQALINVVKALEEKLQEGINRNREDISELRTMMAGTSGQTEGSRITKGSMYAGLAGAATVIGILVVLANYLSSH